MREVAYLKSADLYAAFKAVPVFWQSPTGCEEEDAVRLLRLRSEWFKSIGRFGFNEFPPHPLLPKSTMCDTVLTKSGGSEVHMN